MKSSDEIFSECVSEMGYDNNTAFTPTADQLTAGSRAVSVLRAHGCAFTEDEINMLVAGELSEVEEIFCRYAGWEELNKILNDIFNGEA